MVLRASRNKQLVMFPINWKPIYLLWFRDMTYCTRETSVKFHIENALLFHFSVSSYTTWKDRWLLATPMSLGLSWPLVTNPPYLGVAVAPSTFATVSPLRCSRSTGCTLGVPWWQIDCWESHQVWKTRGSVAKNTFVFLECLRASKIQKVWLQCVLNSFFGDFFWQRFITVNHLVLLGIHSFFFNFVCVCVKTLVFRRFDTAWCVTSFDHQKSRMIMEYIHDIYIYIHLFTYVQLDIFIYIYIFAHITYIICIW